jgi:hypothetical protein
VSVSVETIGRCYELFWQHCVERHGLNPDTSELPGLEEAAFFIDLEKGTLTINLKAIAR